MSKLWQKNNQTSSLVEQFTIGKDQQMDQYLATYDVLGSIAHTTMLSEVGLLSKEEQVQLKKALIEIYNQIQSGNFELEEGVEDIHSQVEMLLTNKLGDVGKKFTAQGVEMTKYLLILNYFYVPKLSS
jgi:argininosuccinate lyase